MKPRAVIAAWMLGLLGYGAVEAAPTCEKPTGMWKSAFGYSISIDAVDPTTKQIKGSYVLGEGRDAKRSPLVGFWLTEGGQSVGADARPVVQVAYALPEYGSVTSWTGVCADVAGTQAISMVTHGARVKSPYAWDHVIAASDFFAAQP